MPPVPPGVRAHPRRQRPCARPRRGRDGAGGSRHPADARDPRHPAWRAGRGGFPHGHRFLRLVVAARDELESRQVAEPRRRLHGPVERAGAQALGDGLVHRRRLEGSADVFELRVGRSVRVAQHLGGHLRQSGDQLAARRGGVTERLRIATRERGPLRASELRARIEQLPDRVRRVIGQPIERPRRHRRPTELLHLRRVAVPAFVAQAFRQRVAGGDESFGGAAVQLPDFGLASPTTHRGVAARAVTRSPRRTRHPSRGRPIPALPRR